MKTHELTDDWKVHGTNLDEFKKTLQNLAKSTYVIDTRTKDLTLMHYAYAKPETPNRLMFTIHSQQQIETKRVLGTMLDTNSLSKSGVNEAFINELQFDSKLMMRLGGTGAQREDFYFTSKHLSRDLGMRAFLSGDAIYDPTGERDSYIMSRYMKTPVNVKVVIRRNSDEDNAIHKIFAMPTEGYRYFDQRILLSMLQALEKEFGTAICRNWYIDHFITQLWCVFPDKAKDICETYGIPEVLIPGVLIETSDTCDCSVRATAFWENKKHAFARIGIYEREHRGKFTEKDVLNGIHTKLMPKYTSLPNRLCELLTIDINDPVAAVEAVFQMAHIKKLLGKKRSENLMDILTTLVSSRSTMTGYELAMIFMDIPTMYTMDNLVRVAAEQIAGSVPFLDFEKIAEATTAVTPV